VREHLGADVEARRGWAIVAAVSATVTVSWGVLLYAFPVVFVPMRDELGLTASQLSLAATIALGVSAIAGIGVGWLLDRTDPRVVMTAGSVAARDALRSRVFWLLAAAFALGTFAWSAITVHLVVMLVEQGHPAAFAALAAGITGISQVPGRLLFGPVVARFGREIGRRERRLSTFPRYRWITRQRGTAPLALAARPAPQPPYPAAVRRHDPNRSRRRRLRRRAHGCCVRSSIGDRSTRPRGASTRSTCTVTWSPSRIALPLSAPISIVSSSLSSHQSPRSRRTGSSPS
jgi:MFS family permease